MVDTADVYAGGRSEEIIGRWFASRPADVTGPVVLATKGRMPVDDSPNGAGLSARHLTRALDASLRRLGLETVDLYQVHAYDPLTPLEETLRTIEGFIRAGKIRYWGLSNFTGWQLTKAVHLARALNVAGPVTLQPQYSLLAREIEWEIVPAGHRRRPGPAAVEPARRRLAVRQVPARPAPHGRDPPRRGSRPRHGSVRPARHRPHLARDRRRAENRRGPRRVHGRGRAGLGDRPARGQLDHPRRPHDQPARDQPARGRPAPDRRPRPPRSTPPATRTPPTIPTASWASSSEPAPCRPATEHRR